MEDAVLTRLKARYCSFGPLITERTRIWNYFAGRGVLNRFCCSKTLAFFFCYAYVLQIFVVAKKSISTSRLGHLK